ncbi:MAG: MlaD family protein [Chlamydiales bacterium]|nr:MlaD family protein [Chlamydiales bacterium]
MTDQLKNILIGLFVVAAVTIVVAMILFLKPTVGDGKQLIHVRFANIAGINMGTRVTFAGKPVGEVVAIEEITNARETSCDEAGRVYVYQLTLKVDSKVNIYTTDEVAIRTTGLMGEKAIAILPKASPQGSQAKDVTHQTIYANSVDPLENTFQQMTKVAQQVQTAVYHWDQWFQDNQSQLTGAVHSLNTSLEHANQALLEIKEATKPLSSGSGTLGKLLQSDDLYLRFSSLFGKAETLMNDLNHYGLLFQYDKRWQRSRTKRANILKSLDSPKEFHDFFEHEIDTITTSLGRLTELLHLAEETEERIKVMQSEVFRRDFATLLRKSQGLADSIRLYNEGLMESDD